jgi:hypothetical protein
MPLSKHFRQLHYQLASSCQNLGQVSNATYNDFLRALGHRIAYRDAMPTLTVTHEAPLELIR